MSNKEQRSIEQVRQLLGALGFDRAPVLPESPPRLDVFPEVDNRRIAIEATDYHADRMSPGGSAIRRGEQLDLRAGRRRTYAVPIDPLPGLVCCIQAKETKRYEVSATDEVWLAIFAGVPQLGAAATTFLVTTFFNVHHLTAHTADLLETSVFGRCYILCGLTEAGQPKVYSWRKDTLGPK